LVVVSVIDDASLLVDVVANISESLVVVFVAADERQLIDDIRLSVSVIDMVANAMLPLPYDVALRPPMELVVQPIRLVTACVNDDDARVGTASKYDATI
jgi:hypothetical protein